jgi:hypothetical protein
MINPQPGLEKCVQERVKRHVLDADSTTKTIAKSRASVRSCRPAITRVQARGLRSGVPGERSDETGMRSDIHHAPTRSDKSRSLGQYPAPIVHISVDKCAHNRVKACVAERRDTCVGLDQISCSASLLRHVKLVRRHVNARGEPSSLLECPQLYATAATEFETAPRSGTKPVTEQGRGALREQSQVRVIPDSIAVVPSDALHPGNGRTSPMPPTSATGQAIY